MAEGTAKLTQTKGDTGKVISHYKLLDAGGGVAWLESRELDLGNPRDLKYLGLVRIVFDSYPSGLKVRIGYRDRLDEERTWVDYVPEKGLIYPHITSLYYTIRVFDENPSIKWKFTELEFYGLVEGGMFT